MTYTIDNDNNITAHAAAPAAQANVVAFATQAQLTKITAAWPMARLAAIWNTLAGVTQVKKFRDRAAATTRIWQAVQKLEPAPTPQPAPKAARKARTPKTATATANTATGSAARVPREFSKLKIVIGVLQRAGDAGLDEIMKTTGWQKHTVRGFSCFVFFAARVVFDLHRIFGVSFRMAASTAAGRDLC